MVAQGPWLIRVIEYDKPPRTRFGLSIFGHKCEISVNSPGWSKIVMYLLLKRGNDGLHIGILQHSACVNNCNLNVSQFSLFLPNSARLVLGHRDKICGKRTIRLPPTGR